MNIREFAARAFIIPALAIAAAVSLVCLLAAPAVAASITWSGANSATDLNWSDNNNWNAIGSPSGDTVVFNNTGGASSGAFTTSAVDQSFIISSLTFANTGTTSYQNLVIGSTGSGTALTVNGAGGLTFGLTSSSNANLQTNVNISGTGALTVNNASANFVLGLTTSTGNGFADTVNMSGLSSFTFSGSNFDVGAWTGSGGSRSTGGILDLAATSSITTSSSAALDVGDNGLATNTSNITSTLALGTGTNTIDTNMFNVGRTKAAGAVAFYSTAGSAAGVTIRGSAGGSSRVTTISIGDHLAAASTNATGTMDFSLGQVNAMIGNLYIGTCDNIGSTGDGIGTFIVGPNPNSVVDVTTMNLATVGSGRTTATVKIEGGTFAFGTIPAPLGTATLSFSGGSTICSNTASSTETPAFNLGTSGTSSTVTFGNPGLGYTGSMTFNGAATLLGSTTLQVNAPTTLAGAIGDNSSGYGLTLSGTGVLALNSANTYGGGTTIHSGTMSLGALGTIGSGSLTINPGGAWNVLAYGSTGYSFTGAVLTAGRNSSPGIDISGNLNVTNAALALPAANSTMTIGGSLSLTGGTVNYYAGDTIALAGSGALSASGDYIDVLTSIGTGTYTLFTGSSVPANPASYLAITGDTSSRQNYAFNISAGTAVTLTVSGVPASLRWSGGSNSTWDTGASQSWYNLSTSAADYFFGGDNVTFNDTPGTATSVNISGPVQPGSVTVSNTNANYTFTGAGSIGGVATLVKNGPGTLTINTGNSYAGGTSLGGGLLNLGNATAIGSGPLVISGGSLDNTSGALITLSGSSLGLNGSFTFVGSYPLNTGTGAVTLGASPTVNVNSGGMLTVGGVVSGPYGLTMTGAGMLVLAASNNYTGNTLISQGTLQLAAAGAIPTGAGTGNVLFTNAGASAVLDLNGNDATVNGLSQPSASATNMVVNNGSFVMNTLSVGNNNATSTFAGVLADNNNGNGGTLALTKLGTGTLTLAGMNTYSGPTTVNGGTLALATGTNLPSTTTLNFSGNGTFSMGANNQAIAGLTTGSAVNNSFTGAVTGAGNLTVNAASSMLIGGANPNQTATLVMSNVGTFNYNGASYIFDVGAQYTGATLSSNGAGTLWLAASNTITANRFGVASNGSNDQVSGSTSTGVVYLGQANVINAATIEVGYNNQRSSVSGTLEFAPGSVNPTLAIYGVSGPGSRAEIQLGNIGESSFVQNATGTIDLVTGVTGTSLLTAYVDQMVVGFHDYFNNGHPAIGTFNMGGGTMDANAIIVGELNAGASGCSASGAFSLNGGTVLAGSITLAVLNVTAGPANGTFNLNSGLVSASAIASGTGSAAFNWSSGTITNYNPIYGLGGDAGEGNLTISGATLSLASTGTHSLWIDLGYTGSSSSSIAGAGGLTVNGPGALLLAASSSFSGGTTLSTGSLQLGSQGALGVGGLTISSGTLDLNANNTAVGSLSGPGGVITDNSPASGTTTLTVNQTSNTTFAGVLQDGANGTFLALALSGTGGSLTLAVANHYSGPTTITSGTLALGPAGTLGSGNLTVNPGGVWDVSAYGPAGYTFNGGVLTAGRTASPATDINGTLKVQNASLYVANGSAGTMTISGGLGLSNGTLNYAAGELVAVGGALTFSGTDYVTPLAPLVAGSYSIFTYSGGAPNTADLAIGGGYGSDPRDHFTFAASGGVVTLSVSGAAANLRWFGGSNSTWDTGTSQNWYNFSTSAADYFYPGDSVTFNDTPGTATAVNISGTVQPGSVTVSNTNANYTFGGAGSIAGIASLTKNGPGSLTLATSNMYTGGTILNGGVLNDAAINSLGSGTLGVYGGTANLNNPQLIAAATLAGGLLNLGNAAAVGSGPLVISGGSLDNTTGSPLTLSASELSLNGSFTFIGTNPLNTGSGAVTLGASPTVNVNSGMLTVGGGISGPYGLTLTGTGMLVLAASDNYTGNTSISQGTLQLAAAGAIPTGAGTGNVLFTNAAAAAVLDLNGSNTTINGLSQPTASSTNMVVNNVPGSGLVTLSVGNNDATSTFSGMLADNNNFSGGMLALTKIGTGMLTLGGMNTFSGPTTINGGTLALATGTNLPNTTTVNFSGNGTFSVGPNNQAIAGLAVADSFTGTVTGAGSLTVNATGSMLIGGANPNQAETLVMSGLGAFNYNGPSYTFDVGCQYTGTASVSSGAGTVWLAASNTITANLFGVASRGSQDQANGNVSTGLVYLGQANAINASTIDVGTNNNTNQRTSTIGTLAFAPGSVNPTLTIDGTSGPGSRAEINVGVLGETSFAQYANGTIDLVTGVTGTSALYGYVDQMILGNHARNTNQYPASGVFNMGGGTLDANTILIGDMSAGSIASASASGTFSLNGGTVLAGQINLGVFAAGTVGSASGTFNLNNGLLSASAVSSGTGTAVFNWSAGTIANYDPIYGLGGDAAESNLSISVPTLTLAPTGTHAFWIDSGYTASVSSAITGGGAVANVGPGTLVLSGTNAFEGGLDVPDGTVILTDSEALAEGTSLIVGNASVLSAFEPAGAIGSSAPAGSALANVAVPEPGTSALALAAVGGAILYRRRRRSERKPK